MKYNLIILFITLYLNLDAQILSYSTFRTPSEVDDAINTLANTYPSLTSIQTLGYSVEGRPIRALKISTTPTVNDPTKGDVVYMSLIHAREWISVETLLYITDRLLNAYSSNEELRKDLDKIQLWVIPVC